MISIILFPSFPYRSVIFLNFLDSTVIDELDQLF